jgi:DNA-directed RNA polymerase
MNKIEAAIADRLEKQRPKNESVAPVIPAVSAHASKHAEMLRSAGLGELVEKQLIREASSSRRVSTEQALATFATDFNRAALSAGIEAFRVRLETASVTKTGLVQAIKHGGYSLNPVNSLSVDQQLRAAWQGIVSMAGRMVNKDQPTSVQAMGAAIGERLRKMGGMKLPETDFRPETAGLLLLKHFEFATEWIIENDGGTEFMSKSRKPNTVNFTEKFRVDILGGGLPADFAENRPMLVPPVPWTEKAIRGGYLNSGIPAIRRSDKAIRSPAIVSALNAMQSTPFRVNKRVLALANEMRVFADELPGKLIRGKLIDERHDEPEAVQKAKTMRSALTLGAMNDLQDAQRFYFPWNLDWRGRMYPATSIISPQGADLCKGCLEFADGTPVGPNGGTSLAWQLCALAGADKEVVGTEYLTRTPPERIEWVQKHLDTILAIAHDPESNRDWHLTENRFGLVKIKGGKVVPVAVDKPWQFLAACFEWAGFVDACSRKQGDEFISHLAASLDGSCSGVQMLAGMTRDEKAGTMVNLTQTTRGDDYYGRMAMAVTARLCTLVDAATTKQDARLSLWATKTIDRDLLKAPSMTKVYSAGTYTFGEQLKNKTGEPESECLWLAGQINKCFADVAPGVLEAMGYLQKVATVMTDAGKPLNWTTPAGLAVSQAVYGTIPKKLHTEVGDFQKDRVFVTSSGKLNKPKQRGGVVPNFVHGVDAAHMVMVVNDLVSKGVTSLWMVHDSFGVPFRDRGLAYDSTREEFGRLMSGDLLRDWTDEVKADLTDEQREKLPVPPARGKLDLEEVKKSWFAWA